MFGEPVQTSPTVGVKMRNRSFRGVLLAARASGIIKWNHRSGRFDCGDRFPAQLPARYGALFATLREEIAPAAARLRKFLDQSAQATRLGAEFDDAATARGLLNGLQRAVECGAASTADVEAALGHSLALARERLGA